MSPIRLVLGAIEAGATTQVELRRRTGLDADVISAVVDHLELMGRISRPTLRAACPPTGCGSCPIASGGACRV